MLLTCFGEDWCADRPFLLGRVTSFRVSGRSRLDEVLTATRVGRLQGVGQGDKFKPSDITGGCLALT